MKQKNPRIFSPRYKIKNDGVSILVVLIVSFILLGIASSVFYLIEKSQEQVTNVERATKVFYAAETGYEAGLYHINARDRVLDFTDLELSGSLNPSIPASQKIVFSSGNQVYWSVDGLAKNKGSSSQYYFLTGILEPHQIVQIPLYWDQATVPNGTPNQTILVNDFFLDFAKRKFDPITGDNTTGAQIIPDSFDFGTAADEPVVNWLVSKIDSSDVLTTFIPRSEAASTLCTTSIDAVSGGLDDSGFYCKDNLDEKIKTTVEVPGYIIPGLIDTYPTDYAKILLRNQPVTLNNFFDDNDGGTARYKLTFQPLLSFSSVDLNEKIQGIPWRLELQASNIQFPSDEFELQIYTTLDDFEKSETRTLKTKTSILGIDTLIVE